MHLSLTLITYYSKNVNKEARGVLFSIFYMTANVGKLIVFGLGGFLFEISSYWPFLFIAFSCMATCLIVGTLFCMGYYSKKVTKAETEKIKEAILKTLDRDNTI